MYKAIIIDDEPIILMGIVKTFPWDKYGFEVVAEIDDPTIAIDEIINTNPDLVLCDICMPQIDGLELLKEMRKRNLDTTVVIISGHDNFSYAQQSIRYDVFDYCLKPLSEAEADNVLRRVKEHLDAKSNEPADESEQYTILPKSPVNSVRFKRLIKYIDENYSQKLQLYDLAEMFDLSTNRCSQLFKIHFDCNYSHYLNKIRIGKAVELLNSTNQSILEIAENVGIMDYYYFNKVFKRIMGVTPYQYRGAK